MTPNIGKFIDISGIKYWYQSKHAKSDISPALLFIHGFSGNRTRLQVLWDFFAERGYPIYRIDLKGHGQSQKEDIDDYSLESCAREIDGFIKNVIAGRDGHSAVAIVAHSMGGFIAQLIAINEPEYLRALVLISAVPKVSKRYRRLLSFAERFYPLIMRFLFRRRRKDHEALGVQYFPEWMPGYEYLRPDTDALKEFMGEMTRIDLTSELGSIKVPTLVFAGSDDDFATPDRVQCMDNLIPDSEVYNFPDTGHFPYLDYPDEIARAILDLISQ